MSSPPAVFRAYAALLALIELPSIFDIVVLGGKISSVWYDPKGASLEANYLNAAFLACLVSVRLAVALDRRRGAELGIAAVMVHAIEVPLFTALWHANVSPKLDSDNNDLDLVRVWMQSFIMFFVYVNPFLFAIYYFGGRTAPPPVKEKRN